MDFSGGVKHWNKCKLRTALQWVVFTLRRTERLELTTVLDAGKILRSGLIRQLWTVEAAQLPSTL